MDYRVMVWYEVTKSLDSNSSSYKLDESGRDIIHTCLSV